MYPLWDPLSEMITSALSKSRIRVDDKTNNKKLLWMNLKWSPGD